MRVTNSMISSQVIFNLQRSLSRYYNLENDMSSGRKINTPSDDPGGTVQDLNYRTELAKIEQYRSNVAQAQNWTNSYDTILSDLVDFTNSAKDTAISMADGVYDENSRESAAQEVRSLFDQMIQLANNQLDDRYVFSGFRTQEKAITVTPNGIVYDGDDGQMKFPVESAQKMTVNLNGSDVFLKELSVLGGEADVNVRITDNTLLTDLNGGEGIDLTTGSFTLEDKNLNISATIDLTAAPPVTTVNELLTRINDQLAASVPPITNVTAVLGDEGNNIRFEAVGNGLISGLTPLDNLNDGYGVDNYPGTILVSDGTSINVEVDLSEAKTIDEVINTFNTALTNAGISNVTMSINAAGTGLQIDDTNGVPLGLTISDMSYSEHTAEHLGIVGDIGAQMIGGNLSPEPHFEIKETTGSTAADLGILGEFYTARIGDDINPALTASASLSDLNNGLGFDDGQIVIKQGDTSFTVDFSSSALTTVQDLLDLINTSGLDVTASINESGTGIQIENNDPNRSLMIQDLSGGRAAKDLGIYGSSDMLGTMLVLIDALDANDQEGTGMLIGSLDDAVQRLLTYRGLVGTRAVRLEDTENRLENLSLNYTTLLTEVEDADLTELATALSTAETSYSAALYAASSIIQPTLMDFLV
ncbi:MAG: flagellar hook-associated protein FlgL [Candidatus Zixiibacteriota bacterium]